MSIGIKSLRVFCIGLVCTVLFACSDGVQVSGTPDAETLVDSEQPTAMQRQLSVALQQAIESRYVNGIQALLLPESDDFNQIPQDPKNPLSTDKVALGKLLFHDTALAMAGQSGEEKTWSCATCHHAAAGFKAGVPQGIGEGGRGFGLSGSQRVLSEMFNATADKDAPNKPDIQPLASPSILNTAYQSVMLWNGQFGNGSDSSVNDGLPPSILATEGTPKLENSRGFSGVETQAVAGLGVHRLVFSDNPAISNNTSYRTLFDQVFPESSDETESAALAIAAFERTVLANRAPFQQWLRGDASAMDESELRGAVLFFDKAGCHDCHRGPALSSEQGANEADMFMAIGFADFDTDHPQIHGEVSDADIRGRGGFTGEPSDNFKFKIPQLYNLKDTSVFGHGASFQSIRAVLEYKNRAVPQQPLAADVLDTRLTPLNLTQSELDDLEAFLSTGLYDPDLMRYQPSTVPSGECVVVDPLTFDDQGLCPSE